MKLRTVHNKYQRKLKDRLMRYFLVFSIIFSVFIVSSCDKLIDLFGPGSGADTTNPPEFGSSESSSFTTTLFKSVAEGAAEGVTASSIDWAMSALGLSDESPDYAEQLDKIDEDLQEIISQLKGITNELISIEAELTVINCSEWAAQLKDEKSRVDNLLADYQTFVNTAAGGGSITNANISDWVDQVLAIGNYSSQKSMGQVLTSFTSTLTGPANTGVIPACVQSISSPAENSFESETDYYNQVKLFTDYYYAYQVRALFLYSEARHYQAWVAAGSPNSDYLSADSVSSVCSNSNAALYCNDVAAYTNNLYNALIDQLTSAGAPYSDENLVMMYSSDQPYLWPLSLENFTTAAGDNCADPLTSGSPCGIAAGFYDTPSMGSVIYKGYTGWLKAGQTLLTNLLAGWTTGTAGNYLEQKLGFKNMENKVIISSNVQKITLNETGSSQYVIPFFDTDWDYNFLPGGGGPAITEIQFRQGPLSKSRSQGDPCGEVFTLTDYYISVNYKMNSKVPSNRDHFYDAAGHARYCTANNHYSTSFSFSTLPGYLAQQNSAVNHESSARQYRWPVEEVANLTCTENRAHKNAGGIWTMCGDDLTAYLDYYVPRPETCDNPSAGVGCRLSASETASAKAVFGHNAKSGKRI